MVTIPALLLPLLLVPQTGFDQSGGVRVWGPNGLQGVGAYRFEQPASCRPPNRICYRFTVVLEQEIPTGSLAPDIVTTAPAQAWGDKGGHYWWHSGDWTLEMIAIDPAIRQQVSWEAERMGWKIATTSPQDIDITVGRDTITIYCQNPQ